QRSHSESESWPWEKSQANWLQDSALFALTMQGFQQSQMKAGSEAVANARTKLQAALNTLSSLGVTNGTEELEKVMQTTKELIVNDEGISGTDSEGTSNVNSHQTWRADGGDDGDGEKSEDSGHDKGGEEYIQLQSREERELRQRRQHSQGSCEPAVSAASNQSGRSTGYENSRGNVKRQAPTRSRSENFVPTGHASAPINMNTLVSAAAPAPSVPPKTNRRRREKQAWERGGLAAIIASNMKEIEIQLEIQQAEIKRSMWRPTPHNVD
ncbi:hypothetical protein BGZ76_003168, partial [Entomortierella beljakovae]